MRPKNWIKAVVTLMLIGAGGYAALAAITSPEDVVTMGPSPTLSIPLRLNATAGESVAGINGQFSYDPALFTNPRVVAGPGAPGFVALANEVAPGQVRFVLYGDPVRPMQLDQPVLQVELTGADGLPVEGSTELTFLNGPIDPGDPNAVAQSAAATTDGIAIDQVQLSRINIVFARNSIRFWQDYP